MNQPSPSARIPVRPLHRRLVVGVTAVIAAIAATLGHQAQNSSSSRPSSHSPSFSAAPPSKFADGAVPDGTTVFDEEIPAVAKLDPELRKALRRAAEKAANDGVSLYVNGGWRSPRYQERLLREAIAKYGSEAEAARWVATAKTSPHVSGEAVDIGRSPATAWLSGHGAAYGLCQIYRNEPWHYELRPEATDRGCPQMYADPTQDPRMQK
ncbi:peptidase M15 [Streptomyces sp. BG9H]|uniref:Peptidase M15 n=1 Tax=Streptomyces anatolicus TaxID=2675858 RepID=A0ABS6YFE3_9ACTN|nr:M15 family metallopeptidase [Streptomyces anatolicus]MBW5420130.1 peptidase M15 [Streptomyces anatolicus]